MISTVKDVKDLELLLEGGDVDQHRIFEQFSSIENQCTSSDPIYKKI